jgi:hypothetical protein
MNEPNKSAPEEKEEDKKIPSSIIVDDPTHQTLDDVTNI